MVRHSVVIFAVYIAVYCTTFIMTSIYCAFLTIKNQSQSQSLTMIGSCFTCKAFKLWIKLTWSFKRLYLSIIPHIFDQASDIGVIYEYYTFQFDNDIKNVIDTNYLFWMSIILFLLSRLVSSFAIYRLTKNKKDLLLGLLDLVMMKAVYVGYILKRESPTNIQRYIGLLEASLEAFPQLLISTFFITTVVAHDTTDVKLSPLIPLSLIFSLYSLTSRVASDDKTIYNSDWKNLKCKFSCKKFAKCKCVNWRYIARVFLRFMEISSRLILYVLLWINFGGLATGILLFIEFTVLLVLAYKGGSIEIIGNMMYFVMAGDVNSIGDTIMCFLWYRVFGAYAYLIIITVFSNADFNASKIPNYNQRRAETIDSQFGLGLLIYCWICHFIWPCVGSYVAFKFARRDYGYRSQNKFTTRTLDCMIQFNDCDAFVDLITFGVPIDSMHELDVILSILVYYSMLHAVNDDNNFILDPNTRNKSVLLMEKYGLDKKIHFKECWLMHQNKARSFGRWNNATKLSRHGAGYLLMESNDIVIDCGIDLQKMGYFGDNKYNNDKSKIQNERLQGKLYHGSSNELIYCEPGYGTLILFAKNEIILANNIELQIGNGNAFICCKKLVIGDQTVIDANVKQPTVDDVSGTIEIYCDEVVNSGHICPLSSMYRGTYQQGLQIMNQRK